MKPQIALYDPATERLIRDISPDATALVFETNRHGCKSLKVDAKLPDSVAMELYRSIFGAPDVRLNTGPRSIWRGRLEDISVRLDSAQMVALGDWRHFFDEPYTALWSTREYGRFSKSTDDDKTNRRPEMFEQDNKERLYIAPRNGESFGVSDVAGWTLETPDGSSRTIKRVTFDWEVVGAGALWKTQLRTYPRDFSGIGTTEWAQSGAGSGSQSINLTSPQHRIEFLHYRDDATPAAITADTGDAFVKITNVRVMSVAAATITENDIISELITNTNALNGRILDDTSRVTDPGNDIIEMVIEDALPADVLTALANAAGYEVGVWEDRRLFFEQPTPRNWLVELDTPTLERTLSQMANGGHAVYRDTRGETRRTSAASKTDSQNRNSFTRKVAIEADTTDQTTAEAERDRLLGEVEDPEIPSRLTVSRLMTIAQADAPKWRVRAHDTVTVVNLPPTLPESVTKRLEKFTVYSTRYDAFADDLVVEPNFAPVAVENAVESAIKPLGGRGGNIKSDSKSKLRIQ